MVEIIFTKRRRNLFAKLIMLATKEPVSHVAIRVNKTIFEATFPIFHISHEDKFTKKHDIVYSVKTDIPLERLTDLLAKNAYSFFDVGAIVFLGVMFGLRAMGIKWVPKSNLWRATGAFMCTELATELVDSQENAMITPLQLYRKLLKRYEGLQ